MKRAEEEYKEEGLKVIWIGFQDKKDKIMEFILKHGIDSSVGFDKRNLISIEYGIAYGAGLIAINKEGIVIKRIAKGFTEDELIELLKPVIYGTSTKQK